MGMQPPNSMQPPTMQPPTYMPPQAGMPPPQAGMPPPPNMQSPPNNMQPPTYMPPQANMPPPANVQPPANAPMANAFGSDLPARRMSAREQIISGQRSRLRAGVGASNGAVNVPQMPGAPAAIAPDMDTIFQVLEEFAQSEYARKICEYCNVPPTDYGRARGMFEEVRVNDRTLVVKLRYQFEQRADRIFDQLKRYFRQRMGDQLRMLSYESKSPPSTKTYMI